MGALNRHVARAVAGQYLDGMPAGIRAVMPVTASVWHELARSARAGGVPFRVGARAIAAAKQDAGLHDVYSESYVPPRKTGTETKGWSGAAGSLTAVRARSGQAISLRAYGMTARKREARISVAFLQTEVWDHAIDRAVERTGSKPRVLLREAARTLSLCGLIGRASPAREMSEFALPMRNGLLLGEVYTDDMHENELSYTARASRNSFVPSVFEVVNTNSGQPFRVVLKTYVHDNQFLPEQAQLADRLRRCLEARLLPPDPSALAHLWCDSAYPSEHWHPGTMSLWGVLREKAAEAADIMEEYRDKEDGHWAWRDS